MLNLSRYTLYIQALFDVLSFILSFFFSQVFKLWVEKWLPFGVAITSFEEYTNLLLVSLISYVLIYLFVLSKQDVLNRTKLSVLSSSLKTVIIDLIFVIGYLYFTKTSEDFSRVYLFSYGVFSFLFMTAFRITINKYILPSLQHSKNAEHVLLVSTKKGVRSVLDRIKTSNDWRITIIGIVLLDVDAIKEDTYIDDLPVYCGRLDLANKIPTLSMDSVFLFVDTIDSSMMEFIRFCNNMGKTIHVKINEYDSFSNSIRAIDEIGGCPVVSYRPMIGMPKRIEFLKQSFDFILAIPLLIPFAIIYFLTKLFSDKGPIILKCPRVGKNGRRFYQRRFRVMRMDAQERIQHNQSAYTMWGKFLKVSHLYGLPKIINVLMGEMSFVGPKAPTISQYIKYSTKQRKNMCIKPGVTGYWASDLNEDEIIENEIQYIRDSNVFNDVVFYIRGFVRMIGFRIYKSYTNEIMMEEITLINDYVIDHLPLSYDHDTYIHECNFKERIYLFVKRSIDIILSLFAIIILSPLLLILSIMVMTDDFGSPIYQDERIGKDGERIFIYKFRSMRMDAGDLKRLLTEEQLKQYEREFKIDDDPRITSIGSFIRKTSLDELPQLFNILGGSLSFIGPRPIKEEETKIYGNDVAKLLSVKPGLTGYWQAYARNNATYETGERQSMEMFYVENRSFKLDIKIFFHTFVSVIKRDGAK